MKIIGIAGGSGSGKTYFANALQNILGKENCNLISQDNYYLDQSDKFDFDGGSVNFDHPDSLDFTLLCQHLTNLRQEQVVNVPIYEFKTHKRIEQTLLLTPRKYVLVDGILILCDAELRTHFDKSVFIDTPENVRFSRRLKRDIDERGRTKEGVENQFFKQVKPMHDQFVEPSKIFANITIQEIDSFQLKLEEIKKLLCA